MTEMNRRDYLKQMGFATAVAMGSNLHSMANVVLPYVGQWPTTATPPDPANFGVKLIFAGMVIFGYRGREARVAFNRGHTNTHKLRIIVSEIVGSGRERRCTDIYEVSDQNFPVEIDDLEVGIEDQSSDIRFFLGNNFNRAAGTGDPLDFRWLVDLEGPDGYNKELRLRTSNKKFTTKLKVKHGTFYTYQRTYAMFNVQGGPFNGRPYGRIAKVMAANIRPLSNGESVYLRVDDNDVLPYPLTNRAQYEIYFINERVTGSGQDFDMVFEAVDIDAGDVFTLRRVSDSHDEATTDLCHNLPLVHRATDEAPCMGGGFSGGKGFP